MRPASAIAILAGSVILCLGSAGSALWHGTPELRIPSVALEKPYRPPALDGAAENPPQWNPPAPQSAGADWVFELFSPPQIYFDASAAEFRITAPGAPLPPRDFELQLHAIERPWYRLQFQGYAGTPERALITIRNRETGGYVAGRVGDAFPEHGFRIHAFRCERRRVADEARPHATPYAEESIDLTVLDERLGREISLDSKARRAPQWHALFRERGDPLAIHSLREGEQLRLGAARFTLEGIDARAGAVTVVRECPEHARESRTLSLATPSTPTP